MDYIAYSQYTANDGTTDINDAFVEAMFPRTRNTLQDLDLIVFIPISDRWPVNMEDDGIRSINLHYRSDVDAIFKQIYRDKRFNVMPTRNAPQLIELWGSREQRLERIEQAIEA